MKVRETINSLLHGSLNSREKIANSRCKFNIIFVWYNCLAGYFSGENDVDAHMDLLEQLNHYNLT